MGDDWGILSNVAEGITNYRSPGNEIDRMHDVFKRRAAGDLLAPEGWVSIIVDRKDPLAAQGALTVSSAQEAIEAVRKIKAAGMWGVKFYTSMDPSWIAPAATSRWPSWKVKRRRCDAAESAAGCGWMWRI